MITIFFLGFAAGGGQRLAMLWNVLGLPLLANVLTRALLTAPGPLNLIHVEVPNRMIGTFPCSVRLQATSSFDLHTTKDMIAGTTLPSIRPS